MQEHNIKVTRTARFSQLGSFSQTTEQVWMVCHGYGQLAPYFLRHFVPVHDQGRVIVAPEGLSRFYLQGFSGRVGASWMTREDRLHEIDDYIAYLDAVWDRVIGNDANASFEAVALGFSQGTATAARWAARGRIRVDRLILWAEGMPPDLDDRDLERLRNLEIVQVVGNSDPFANKESLSRQKEFFEQHDLQVRLVRFDGGHELHSETLKNVSRRAKK